MNMMTTHQTTEPMMSSKEIAELTGKRHADVIRDIRAIVTAADKAAERGNADLRYQLNQGLTEVMCPTTHRTSEFMMNRYFSEVLVTGYDVVRRAKVITRWLELESKTQQPQLPNFNNPVEAARAWADAKEAEQQALVQLESAKPAVAFVEKYVTTTGNKGFRAVAKLLGVKENVFRNFLSREKIQYKLGGEWLPYAQHINLNRFVVKTGATEDYTYNQSLFTPKGVEWIADKWNKCKHRYGY